MSHRALDVPAARDCRNEAQVVKNALHRSDTLRCYRSLNDEFEKPAIIETPFAREQLRSNFIRTVLGLSDTYFAPHKVTPGTEKSQNFRLSFE